MKAVAILITLIAALLMSCNPARFCARHFPPGVERDTTIVTEVVYRDTVIYITLPADTVVDTVPIYIEVQPDGTPQVWGDTARAMTHYSKATAWVGGGSLGLQLINREYNLTTSIDSAIRESSEVREVVVTKITKIPEVPGWARPGIFLIVILLIILAITIARRR